MPTEPERDPVEWAQHTALVAISVARTVLDLAEAAVADRERLERLATTGRSFAETFLGDAARVASTVVSGFGFETEAKPATAPPPQSPAPAPEQPPTQTSATRAAEPKGPERQPERATTRPRSKTVKAAPKKAAKPPKSDPSGAEEA